MSRCAGHEPDGFPHLRAPARLSVHRGPMARRRRGRPRRAPRAAGAVGADGVRWPWWPFGGFGAVLYAGLWMFLPGAAAHRPAAPGLDAATRQGKRGGRRAAPARRLRPARRGRGDRDRRTAAGHPGHRSERCPSGRCCWPAPASRVLWWQADEAQRERWLDSSRRMNALRAVVGGGGWRVVAAHRSPG